MKKHILLMAGTVSTLFPCNVVLKGSMSDSMQSAVTIPENIYSRFGTTLLWEWGRLSYAFREKFDRFGKMCASNEEVDVKVRKTIIFLQTLQQTMLYCKYYIEEVIFFDLIQYVIKSYNIGNDEEEIYLKNDEVIGTLLKEIGDEFREIRNFVDKKPRKWSFNDITDFQYHLL
jgi:hypothetical protein